MAKRTESETFVSSTNNAGVSVVIPIHEFPAISHWLAAWKANLSHWDRPVDFHVVDHPHLGEAIRQGIAASAQPWILLLVPEYSYRPKDARSLISELKEVDVVLGVRPGRHRSTLHSWWLHASRWFCRVVFGIEVRNAPMWYGLKVARTRWWRRLRFGLVAQDAECGLRLIRREVLKRCPIQSDGRFALVEMLAKLNFIGALMAETTLGPPGDLPVMRSFATSPSDERRTFRHPRFAENVVSKSLETKKTASEEDLSPDAVS